MSVAGNAASGKTANVGRNITPQVLGTSILQNFISVDIDVRRRHSNEDCGLFSAERNQLTGEAPRLEFF
jgi:hypothetical protein